MRFVREDHQFQLQFNPNDPSEDINLHGPQAMEAFLEIVVIKFMFNGMVIIRERSEPDEEIVTIPADRTKFIGTIARCLSAHLDEVSPQLKQFFHWYSSGYRELVTTLCSLVEEGLMVSYDQNASLQFQCALDFVLFYDVVLKLQKREDISLDMAVGILRDKVANRIPDFAKMAAEQRAKEVLDREHTEVQQDKQESPQQPERGFNPGDKVWFHRSNGDAIVTIPGDVINKMGVELDAVTKFYQVQLDLTSVGLNLIIPFAIASANELTLRDQ